jgi:hypothetical protein
VKLLKCHIIVTVLALAFSPAIICAQYLWHSHSTATIDIDAQTGHHITAQSDVLEGSVTITLDVNGPDEAHIAADNGPAAQLHNATDHLVTGYWLTFSGNGVDKTGGSDTSYETYDNFLKNTPATIKHVQTYDTVDVTLHVRVNNTADNVADSSAKSGVYTATQTLTVTW